MPKLITRPPKYAHHKASGQAKSNPHCYLFHGEPRAQVLQNAIHEQFQSVPCGYRVTLIVIEAG